MWRKMKLFILRWLTKQALKKGWYYRWSRVYQFLFERKRIRNHRIPPFISLTDGVEKTVDRMRWVKDTWIMLFDAISHPHATVGRHLSGFKAGDCDDISLFAAWSIRDMMERGYLEDFRFVGLLSIPWLSKDGKCAGHNVCVISYIDKQAGALRWAHISNWHSGKVQTHNRLGHAFSTVEDVVRNVIGGNTSTGWARVDCDLNLLEYDDGRNL